MAIHRNRSIERWNKSVRGITRTGSNRSTSIVDFSFLQGSPDLKGLRTGYAYYFQRGKRCRTKRGGGNQPLPKGAILLSFGFFGGSKRQLAWTLAGIRGRNQLTTADLPIHRLRIDNDCTIRRDVIALVYSSSAIQSQDRFSLVLPGSPLPDGGTVWGAVVEGHHKQSFCGIVPKHFGSAAQMLSFFGFETSPATVQ